MTEMNLHVVTHEADGWAVKREGTKTPESTHTTQQAAIDAARDIAEEENGNIVIHRRNGQIRNVKSFDQEQTDGKPADNRSRSTSEEEAPVGSVGSRIRWGAVLAGLVLTLTTGALLAVLGIALTITLANVMSADGLKIFGGVWATLTLLASLFCGGMVITRLTLGDRDALTPFLYGGILWGLVFVILPLLPLSNLNLGFGVPNATTATASPEADVETLEANGLNPEQAEKLQEAMNSTPSTAGLIQNNATEAAWLTFVAMLLSLVAAIGGAVTGNSYPVTVKD